MFETSQSNFEAQGGAKNFSSSFGTGGSARICFVGDLMLGRKISRAIGERQARAFWGDTLDLLTEADAVVANLESPITDHEGRWSEGWKAFRFAASPRAIDLLQIANVRALNIANNHMLDCNAQGLADTLTHLKKADISCAGAGMNLHEAWKPTLFRAGPITVGLIGCTDNMKEFAAQGDKPGTSYLRINNEPGTLALIDRLVQEVRAAGGQTVILSIHWGPNLRPWPPARFRKFARAAIGLGVNVVHGHSAHLVQGVEFHGGGLILYDTGDFLTDYWVFPGIRIDHSFAFVVDYQNYRPVRLNLVPVKLKLGRISLAQDEDFAQITNTMIRRSKRLGTRLRRVGHGLALEIPNVSGIGAAHGYRLAPTRPLSFSMLPVHPSSAMSG
jgi:poly-gamma-glutamate synthesis protein (capsule biosynthesis protein)